MPHEVFGPFEQRHLRLVDGHAGDALELGELVLAGLLLLLLQLTEMRLAVGEALLAPRELRQLAVDFLLFGEHALLDLDDAGAVLHDLLVDLGP